MGGSIRLGWVIQAGQQLGRVTGHRLLRPGCYSQGYSPTLEKAAKDLSKCRMPGCLIVGPKRRAAVMRSEISVIVESSAGWQPRSYSKALTG